jgi:RNA polymerase sigma-32 factor
MLEPQEEYMLAKRWREHGDRDAASARHQPSAARGQDRHGLPRLWPAHFEVISEGNVGLMQAVKRFEPEKGFRLTYAMWWIKAAIRNTSALLVAGEDGHDRQPEEAILQPAQGQSRISALDEAICGPTRSSSSPSGWA